MASRHGTRWRYNEGCRCDDCRAANTAYRRRYRERRLVGITDSGSNGKSADIHDSADSSEPGPVESAVHAEISDLAAEARPGLTQTALALARIMANPRATNQQAAAAKTLASLLDKLASVSARGRRGTLSLVKSMTTSPPSA